MQRLLRQSHKLVFKINRGKCGRVRVAICNKEISPSRQILTPLMWTWQGLPPKLSVTGRFHICIRVRVCAPCLSRLQSSRPSCHFLRARIWPDLSVILLQQFSSSFQRWLLPASNPGFAQLWQLWSSPLQIKKFRNRETSSYDKLGQSTNSALPLRGWAFFHRHKPERVAVVCCEPETSHQVT